VADGAQGIKVTGTSCDLNGSTGWLLDYDPTDGNYYLDNAADSPSPVAVDNGGWAYDDKPIGNPGDKDQTYGITIVLASPACARTLMAAKPDSAGDIKFKTLPPGCQPKDTVDVVVSNH
jgi:hypothetical protein